jgi:hypothetical protein
MNAANDLSQFSKLNMNQMEKVAGNPDVRFVVQWKQDPGLEWPTQFNGTRRYLVTPDSSDNIASTVLQDMGTKVDMGLPSTLRDFVTWGKAAYPADRYVLVVWNHGNGWMRGPQQDVDPITRGVSYDEQTGNAIQTWQLDASTRDLGIDVLAFDASLMQMAEVAYEMRNNFKFIVGSEESPPGEGYPYDRVFSRFRDNPDASTAELTKAFVDGMLENPPYATRKITQSVLDCSKLSGVATAASALANVLIAHPEVNDEVEAARNATQAYGTPSISRHYFDMIGFAQGVSARVSDPDVKAACAAFVTAVQGALVWEGHNALSAGSRGLAIDLSTASQFAPRTDDYAKLQWGADTTWDDWLKVAP